jgi:hypothetical protein
MVWVQILSREEQKFDSSKNLIIAMLDRERGYHTFILVVDKPKIISAQLNLFREKENLN